jgi:hypothetical protein
MTCKIRDPRHVQLLNEAPELALARSYLLNYRDRVSPSNDDQLLVDLSATKQRAVEHGDDGMARAVWCLERMIEVQSLYLKAFAELESGEFYPAWCTLERCEIALDSLDSHYEERGNRFGLAFIDAHVGRFQSLFPYKLFISPALLISEARCSICGTRFAPRSRCAHRVGEIYDGVQCLREIAKYRVLEVSMVPNPVQKYSVLFLGQGPVEDDYDYSTVRYVAAGLSSPWHGWTYEWTRSRHPHDLYSHVGRNDPCPCESGEKYKNCCLNEPGVLRPHCEITFDQPPPRGLPRIQYSARR